METYQIVFGIILLVFAVFLVVAVLMQSSKDTHLSGSIAGGAESFFGKSKGKTIDKVLSKLTIIVSIIFTILVIVMYVLQPTEIVDPDKYFDSNADLSGETESVEETETSDVDINVTTSEATDETTVETEIETTAETEA